MIKIKRIYEEIATDDGYRILVDRLWPRGVSKEKAGIDLWLKDIAPTIKLRQWFKHEADRFDIFSEKYFDELMENEEVDVLLGLLSKHKNLTLLYSAKDLDHNQAIVLKQFLDKRFDA